MDKKYFEVQVRHNYFMRLTVVSICKIALWSVAYIAVLYFTVFAQGVGIEWAKNGTYKPNVYVEKVNSAALITVIIASVIYLVIWISIIMKIMRQHKAVTHFEKRFYESADSDYYDEVFHNQHKKLSHDDGEEL